MTAAAGMFLLLAPQSQPAQGGSPMLGVLFNFAIIFALFFFLFVRPQQKQRKAHEERIRRVKRGDEVVTVGGIVGEIVHIREGVKDGAPTPTLEDRVTIKSGESRLVIERGRIARVIESGTAQEETTK